MSEAKAGADAGCAPRELLALLRDARVIRARCAAITAAVADERSGWFRLDRSRLPEAAARVAATMRRRHPDLGIIFAIRHNDHLHRHLGIRHGEHDTSYRDFRAEVRRWLDIIGLDFPDRSAIPSAETKIRSIQAVSLPAYRS